MPKNAKSHGGTKLLVSSIPANLPVAIIDDVSSSGYTALRCQKILQDEGAQVKGFISIIDRMRGADLKVEGANMIFKSIFSLADFSEYISEHIK